MTNELKNAVVPKQEGALSVNGDRRIGLGDAVSDKSDLKMPRAKLMQTNSPELIENLNLRAGMLINDLTEEVLPFEFIPVLKFIQWFKFNPRDDKHPDFNKDYKPGEMIWRVTDPHDPRTAEAKFGENGEKPKAMKVMAFLSYFPESPMPLAISFSNTSYKCGKKLNSMLEFARGKVMKYRIKTSLVTGAKGSYYVPDVKIVGQATPEEYAICADWYDQFKTIISDIVVHVDETETESETGEECPIQ